MRKISTTILAGAISAALAGAALAAGFFTNGVPTAGGTQYPTTLPLTGSETLPADTNLPSGLNPASEAITTAQIGSYIASQPSPGNALIGGDATTNLWQRATSGSSVTTTLTYGGPDRWAYWSGTGTAMTVSRDSTAGDLTAGYQYAFKMARTASQTGVVQMCMAQEVESVNSYQFAGSTAELDFRAFTGANFSANLAKMTAYIVTGTGTDQGLAGSNSMAFGLNAGGGGSGGWTGQANATAAVISLGGVSTAGRYSAVANIPTGTTEIAVALCYTPVGTAGTNDYVAFEGIQLVRNPSNASYASATVGYSSTTFPAASFERRQQGVETALQQRYYYQITEGAAITPRAFCHVTTANSVMQCAIPFPVPMRAAPTATYTAGFGGSTTTAETTATACSALATDSTVVFVNSTTLAVAACTLTSSTIAVGLSMTLYDQAGSGAMKYSSEL